MKQFLLTVTVLAALSTTPSVAQKTTTKEMMLKGCIAVGTARDYGDSGVAALPDKEVYYGGMCYALSLYYFEVAELHKYPGWLCWKRGKHEFVPPLELADLVADFLRRYPDVLSVDPVMMIDYAVVEQFCSTKELLKIMKRAEKGKY